MAKTVREFTLGLQPFVIVELTQDGEELGVELTAGGGIANDEALDVLRMVVAQYANPTEGE